MQSSTFIGFSLYALSVPPKSAVGIVTEAAGEFGLSRCSVDYMANSRKHSKTIAAEKFGSLSVEEAAIKTLTFFNGRDLNGVLLGNLSPLVSYTSTTKKMSIVAYVPLGSSEFPDDAFWSRAVRHLKSLYGFATVWNRPQSFWAYAVGISDFASLEGDLLRDTEGGRWGVTYRSTPGLLEAGFFRDIYPFNFLTAAHLNRKIGKSTVMDLIVSDSEKFGVVVELGQNWYFWRLQPMQMSFVREQFRSAGLLAP